MNAYFTEAWRAVATAKVSEFCAQCERLGALAEIGAVNRNEAASTQHTISEAHSLGDVFGPDFVGGMITDAFRSSITAEAAE